MNESRKSEKRLYKNVILQIEEIIDSNGLQSGDRLPTERNLAERLGISRAVIREAFRILEVNGMIVSKMGGGRFFKTKVNVREIIEALGKADLLDLLEMREVIEMRIIDLVLERAGEEDLASIKEALEQSADVYVNDNKFHLALAEASHNNAFYNIMRYNLELMAETRQKVLGTASRSVQMPQEHMEIFLAIKNRDAATAKKVLRKHLKSIQQVIKSESS